MRQQLSNEEGNKSDVVEAHLVLEFQFLAEEGGHGDGDQKDWQEDGYQEGPHSDLDACDDSSGLVRSDSKILDGRFGYL